MQPYQRSVQDILKFARGVVGAVTVAKGLFVSLAWGCIMTASELES